MVSVSPIFSSRFEYFVHLQYNKKFNLAQEEIAAALLQKLFGKSTMRSGYVKDAFVGVSSV